MTTETALIHYPGHLGAGAVTEIDRGLRKITWDHAGQVKRVPAAAAESLVRDGGFAQAVTVEDAAELYGLDVALIEGTAPIGAGPITAATYTPRAGDPVALVVLDAATRRALRKLRPAPVATEPTQTPAKRGKRSPSPALAPAPDSDPDPSLAG